MAVNQPHMVVSPLGHHHPILPHRSVIDAAVGQNFLKFCHEIPPEQNRFANLCFPKSYPRSEEHTSELQSQSNLVCRLLLEKKKTNTDHTIPICTHDIIPIFLTAGMTPNSQLQVTPDHLPLLATTDYIPARALLTPTRSPVI